MSSLSKQDIILNIREEIDNLIEEKVKNFGKIIEKIIELAEKSKQVIGFSDPDFLRVLDAIDTGLERLLNNNSVREAGTLVDTYLDIILEFKNDSEVINRSKKIVSQLFTKKETTYHVIAGDVINHVSDYLEEAEKLDLLGDLLIETGNLLFRRKNFEQSVAYLERGLNYYVDMENKEKIIDELTKILELARRLAVKNNEYAKNYIELANRVSKDANIDFKNDINAQLAYQSYSEHLLKKSKTMVEERKVLSGRLHKKKRNLSKLFKKKEEEEEFY